MQMVSIVCIIKKTGVGALVGGLAKIHVQGSVGIHINVSSDQYLTFFLPR